MQLEQPLAANKGLFSRAALSSRVVQTSVVVVIVDSAGVFDFSDPNDSQYIALLEDI